MCKYTNETTDDLRKSYTQIENKFYALNNELNRLIEMTAPQSSLYVPNARNSETLKEVCILKF